jgi:TolB protein
MRYRDGFLLAMLLAGPIEAATVGAFTDVSDVGTVSRATQASFDDTSATYTIGASGDNMWAERDAFGFAWKQMRGDVALSARIVLQGKSAQGHRKAGVMLRQSLAPDSAYADVVVHGDGLTSLQFRSEAGGPTREVQCAQERPTAVRLEKRGDHVLLSLANEDGIFEASGCTIRIALRGSFYAGLVVCAHDNNAFETAKFSRVSLGAPPERSELRTSAIEIIPLSSLDRKVVYHSTTRLDSPSFTATGDAVCFRNDGLLQRLVLDGKSEPQPIGAENAELCAVAASTFMQSRIPKEATRGGSGAWLPRLSPDSKAIVYLSGGRRSSAREPAEGDYLLCSMPLEGGAPRELARLFGGAGSLGTAPWSGDGKQLVFVSREPD